MAKWLLPCVVMALAIFGWDRMVALNSTPKYTLSSPGLVVKTRFADWSILFPAMLVTLKITLLALAVAVSGGVVLAVLFTQSKFAEMSFFPFAVIMQVMPIVSVAPLIFNYVDNRYVALILCAWIVAFFPILANTTPGLEIC